MQTPAQSLHKAEATPIPKPEKKVGPQTMWWFLQESSKEESHPAYQHETNTVAWEEVMFTDRVFPLGMGNKSSQTCPMECPLVPGIVTKHLKGHVPIPACILKRCRGRKL